MNQLDLNKFVVTTCNRISNAYDTWGTFENIETGDLAIVPFWDTDNHENHSTLCKCNPSVEVIGSKLMITHNAFDGRN